MIRSWASFRSGCAPTALHSGEKGSDTSLFHVPALDEYYDDMTLGGDGTCWDHQSTHSISFKPHRSAQWTLYGHIHVLSAAVCTRYCSFLFVRSFGRMRYDGPRTLPDQPVWLQDAPRNVLFHIRSSGPVSSYAYQRLRLLQTKFELYTMDPSLQSMP